jgi:hypothetical protein
MFRAADGDVLIAIDQAGAEFLAAQSPAKVDRTQRLSDRCGDRVQNGVARLMTVIVVEAFEMIDID